MCENDEEFRDRGTSLFTSLRSKKEKTPNKKKNTGSKSIFTSLVLANIDQKMQLDPNINFTDNFENSHDHLKVKKTESCIPTQEVIKEENVFNQDCASPDSGIGDEVVLKIDPFTCDVYEDVLYNILHHLNKNIDDIDDDLPCINVESAINYAKDAFRIPDDKHDEMFEKVKLRDPPELVIDIVNEDDFKPEEPSLEIYCLLTPKTDNFEALEAQTCLTKILLKHELELSQPPPFFWSGKFSLIATQILKIHSEFRYLADFDLALTQWSAFAEIHRCHPLELETFINILDTIVEVFKQNETFKTQNVLLESAKVFLPACFGLAIQQQHDQEDDQVEKTDKLKTKDEKLIEMFWEAAKTLSDSLLSFIGSLNEESDLEMIKIEVLRKISLIIKKIKKLENFDLKINFEESIKESIAIGVSNSLSRTVNKKLLISPDKETRLRELIRIVKHANNEYAELSDRFGLFFQEHLNIPYAEHLYLSYDIKLTKIVKPIALEISNSKEGNIDKFSQAGDCQSVAKALFELYMEMKKFSDEALLLFTYRNFLTDDYFTWFSGGIDKWCKVSVFSALSRIEKAIKIDNFKLIDKNLKHSSSAVDVLTILYSIKKFWEDVKWPNEDEIAKISDHVSFDICRFAVIYFDNIAERIEKSEMMANMGIFKIPIEVCTAINNINHISLGIQALISELTANKVQDNARLQKTIASALKHGKSRITKLMKISITKMKPTIRKLMIEGAEIVKKENEVGERLITYFDDCFDTLCNDLNKNDFELCKSILWTTVLDTTSEVIATSLNTRRPPIFFTNLRTIFQALQKDLKNENESIEMENLCERTRQIDFLLERHGLNTPKLIHQYYKDRYEMQQQISKSPFYPYGMLSINCYFMHNVLRLEVLNARNLVPLGANRKPDSFVKINIVPENEFPTNLQTFKTKVGSETHFPLYDELFEFELTPEQRSMKDAIIYFNIKDKLLFSSNPCLAEAFLSFADIPEYSSELKLRSQIHLTLTRLQSDDMEVLKTIHLRSQGGDKAAKDFLTKLKSKTVNSAAKSKSPVTKL